MKVILAAFLILSPFKTISNNRVVSPTGTYSSIVQASYSYGVGYIDLGYNGSSSSTQYFMDVDVNLSGYKTGQITLNLTAPTQSLTLNYIIVGGNYVSSTSNSLSVSFVNVDRIYIRFIWTEVQIEDRYDFNTNSDMEFYWTNQGWQICDLTSVTVQQLVTVTDPIIQYVDGIETYIDGVEGTLNSIAYDVDFLGDINNTLNDIDDVLINILNGTVYNNQRIQLIYDALLNMKKMVWGILPVSYVGYSTDNATFDTSSGYHDAGYYWLNNPNFTYEYQTGMYKLIIPLGGVEYTKDNFKFYQYRNNALQEVQLDSALWFSDRYHSTIYFVTNENAEIYPIGNDPLVIYCDKRIYYYSSIDWSLQNVSQERVEFWTLYQCMKQNLAYDQINGNLELILSVLGEINISTSEVASYLHTLQNDINQVQNVEDSMNNQLQNAISSYAPNHDININGLFAPAYALTPILNQFSLMDMFGLTIKYVLFGIVILAVLG